MAYSLKSVFRSYEGDKFLEELYGDWPFVLVFRPISFFVTPIALKLGLSANAVTLTRALIAGLMPLAAWAFGMSPLIAAGLAVIFQILDCVDGNIARTTGTSTALGHYFDFVTDMSFRASFYVTIGLTTGLPIGGFAVAALFTMLARLSRVYAEARGYEAPYARPDQTDGFFSTFVFPFISGLDSLPALLLIAVGLWGHASWLLSWLLAYSLVDFIYSQVAVVGLYRKG